MNRRLFLMAFMPPEANGETLNRCWQGFNLRISHWADEWNKLAGEPGTISVLEMKAWQAVEEYWDKVRNERKRQLKGAEK